MHIVDPIMNANIGAYPPSYEYSFTATPPKGYSISYSNPQWVLLDEMMHNIEYSTLDSLTNGQVFVKYNNVGYTVNVKGSDVQNRYALIAPCFEWLKYDLYYDKNLANNIGSTRVGQNIIYTNDVTLASAPASWTHQYYTLEGLSLSSNATEASFHFGDTVVSAGSTFDATTNGVTLYAVWKPREITISLDAGEGTVSPASVSLKGEDKCPWLPDANREGYAFNGWFIGSRKIIEGSDIEDMTNITLVAKYTVNTYDVVFDANYDGGSQYTTNMEYGAAIPVAPEVVREGWSFVAWEPAPESVGTVPASNVTFKAQWIIDTWHDATFSYQNDDGATNVVVSVREGDYAEVPGDVDVDALTGRSFTGWEPVPATTPITSDTLFTAQYTNNVYTVMFDANYDGGNQYTTNLEYGVAIPAAPEVIREGWSFVAWEPAPESVGTVPASNVTFRAKWSEDIYYDADFVYYDGSVVVTNKNRVKENGYATVPGDFNPDAMVGRSFAGWYPPDPATTPITSNTLFTALYTNNVYEVAFDANGGEGGVTNYLDYALPIVAPTVTRIGSSFVAWEPTPAETVPASNVCYRAQYTNNVYEVIFDANGGVGGYATNLEYGVAIPAAPELTRDGWSFVAWEPDPESVGTVPASNVTFMAQWEKEKPKSEYSQAADSNIELTPREDTPYLSIASDRSSKGETSIKVSMPMQEESINPVCITGVVYGVGTISFKARSSIPLEYSNSDRRGLYFSHGDTPLSSANNVYPDTDDDDWKEIRVEKIGEPSKYTRVWWFVSQKLESPAFDLWIDEITWTPASAEPTEEDRPVVSGFSASSDGGFTLSISNASSDFDYVVLTNSTLKSDAWGEMEPRFSGEDAGSILLQRPAGVPTLFYKVRVEAKKQDD